MIKEVEEQIKVMRDAEIEKATKLVENALNTAETTCVWDLICCKRLVNAVFNARDKKDFDRLLDGATMLMGEALNLEAYHTSEIKKLLDKMPPGDSKREELNDRFKAFLRDRDEIFETLPHTNDDANFDVDVISQDIMEMKSVEDKYKKVEFNSHRTDSLVPISYTTMIDDIKNGLSVDFYDNLSPRIIGQYEDNEPCGSWIYLNRDGTLKYIIDFDDEYKEEESGSGALMVALSALAIGATALSQKKKEEKCLNVKQGVGV